MLKNGFHPFHILDYSPWPLLGSLTAGSAALSLVAYLWSGFSVILLISMFSMVLVIAAQWWRDVIRESTFQGEHTDKVCTGLYLGVILFIVSELIFFFSFFFGFFFTCLSPDVVLGCSWPPKGVIPLSCFSVPLLNTLLLLSSGVSITWAHHGLISSNANEALKGLLVTILLGIVFLSVQFDEYFETSFCITDSVYGSFFFLMTGFHGLHVLIGLLFILVTYVRLWSFHFSSSHNLGFEASAWYWHFVDVVWLFLFIFVYWWGGA